MSNKYAFTATGAVKIEGEDGNRVQVLLPGRKKAQWISKTQLVDAPKTLRLMKKADFDQKCGCTSLVDVHGTNVESYNVYGKMAKYEASGVKEGMDASPHMRRKFLKENGFMRAKGIEGKTKDVAEKVFQYQRKGYKIAEVKATKAPAKVETPETAAV